MPGLHATDGSRVTPCVTPWQGLTFGLKYCGWRADDLGMIYAQRLFPFAASPCQPVPLAAGWAVVLLLARRAWAYHGGRLEAAAAAQARMDYPAARRGDRAALARLRVMWAISPRPAVRPLPLP